MENVSIIITNWLIENAIIDKSNTEIYKYGIQQCFVTIFNLLITFIIGAVFNMIPECILFMLFFIPLRKYAGGFHARTQKRCYVYSAVLIIIVMAFIKYYSLLPGGDILLTVVSSFGICILSPIESDNKKLSSDEKKIYKKKACVIANIELLIMVICELIGCYEVMKVILFNYIIIFFLMIIALGKKHGYISNKLHTKGIGKYKIGIKDEHDKIINHKC